jgi:hypothetical protein
MTLRWVAEGLDRACIELAIRPTLPLITGTSPLPRLRLAEERTEALPTDEILFPEPLAPKPTASRSRESGDLRELTIDWAGPSVDLEQSWFAEPLQDLHVKSNWYLRASPRPLVVLIRGWLPLPELSANLLWPLKKLDHAGYDVVIPYWVTGFGKTFKRSPHRIPSRDPSRNMVELIRWTTMIGQLLMLARDLGHSSVVVWGTSLGAHLVALMATRRISVHASLYLLEKPLCRLSDPTRYHGRGTITQRSNLAHRLDQVYRVVSPLDRPPQVDAKNIVVIGGEYDQITPISGAQLLADHFSAPLERAAASHLFDPHRARRILEILRRNPHQ